MEILNINHVGTSDIYNRVDEVFISEYRKSEERFFKGRPARIFYSAYSSFTVIYDDTNLLQIYQRGGWLVAESDQWAYDTYDGKECIKHINLLGDEYCVYTTEESQFHVCVLHLGSD